ncbi:hypothetical protein, partial [Caballeronia udeis]|uniref:hypothetical protein n=1 Tax=Caballeronia udeis TaxID=1232866 RepID=UPI001E461B53
GNVDAYGRMVHGGPPPVGSEDLNDLPFRPYRYGRSVSEYVCLFIASTTYEVGGIHSISVSIATLVFRLLHRRMNFLRAAQAG